MNFGVSEQKRAELEVRLRRCGVAEQDLEETFIRCGGPGGQKVNKTSSGVYLKHRPSGLTVKMQAHRQQRLNRYYARKRLCELLEEQLYGRQSPAAQQQEKQHRQKQRRRRRTRKKLGEQESAETPKPLANEP